MGFPAQYGPTGNFSFVYFRRYGQFVRAFGSEGSEEGQLKYPWGVVCDTAGLIYVCDKENHRIQVRCD